VSCQLVVPTDSNLSSRGSEERKLADAGFAVRRANCRDARGVIAATSADAPIVQWASISGTVVDKLERCLLISCLGLGVDVIVRQATSRPGIAPGGLAYPPSDMCLRGSSTRSAPQSVLEHRGGS
jgi:hypothetical protein